MRARGLVALAPALVLALAGTAAVAAPPQVVKTWAGATHALGSDGRVLSFGDDTLGQLGLGRLLNSPRPVQVGGLSDVRDIAVGSGSIFALKRDGSVWAWGANASGNLLDGTTQDRAVPVRVPNLPDVSAISAGSSDVMLLKKDGTVWVAGNLFQYAGFPNQTTSPVPVSGLSGVVAISNRQTHMLALRSDGTVWTWGRNNRGQLGLGTFDGPVGSCMNLSCVGTGVPQQVPGLAGVVALNEGTGSGSSFVRRADGTVWAWGDNTSGQLGDNTLSHRAVPAAVAGVRDVVAFSAGDAYNSAALAVRADGTVWAWGPNFYGQLGNGTSFLGDAASTPQPVRGLTGIRAVAAGGNVSTALDANGEVWTWGSNFNGELGNGTYARSAEPARVPGLTGVRLLRATQDFVVALKQDGTVWAWGTNGRGQLGATQLNRNTAHVVPGLTDVVALSGAYGSLALTRDGSVFEWGKGSFGSSTPKRVDGLPPIQALSAGSNLQLALATDGTVFGWGLDNRAGQFGQGWPGGTARIAGLSDIVGVAAGGLHALFLRRDGVVLAMGANDAGQLGATPAGTCSFSVFAGVVQPCSNVPLPVDGLTDVVQVAAFDRRSYAVRRDGSLWGWGDNALGAIGVPGGNCTSSSFPGASGFGCFNRAQRIPVEGRVTAVSDTLALTADGAVWTWGHESGTASSAAALAPRRVPGLAPAVAAASSFVADRSIAVVKTDGSLWTLGRNTTGQLGDGSYADAFAPVRVVDAGATAYVSLSGGPTEAGLDPLGVLRRVLATPGMMDAALTDPRAATLSGEVYFTALLPPNSPLLPGPADPGPTGRRRATATGGAGMVVGTLGRDGFKQTGGQSASAAASAYSGPLGASGLLSVYQSASGDPLVGSNAVICMGVTLPELSAKGQVLMRPIATGSEVRGVVQCPPVQTAATIGRYRAQASGTLDARTIVADVVPLAEERGQRRQLFVWAVAPDGRQYMQTGPNVWEAMTEPMRPAGEIVVPAVGPYRVPVTDRLDLRGLVGTQVFIGLGRSWDEVRQLNQAGHCHTVE